MVTTGVASFTSTAVEFQRLSPEETRVVQAGSCAGYLYSQVRGGHIMWAAVRSERDDLERPDLAYVYDSRVSAAIALIGR